MKETVIIGAAYIVLMDYCTLFSMHVSVQPFGGSGGGDAASGSGGDDAGGGPTVISDLSIFI